MKRTIPPSWVVGAALLVSSAASAEGWRVYAEAMTEAPLQVGVKLSAEAPNRLRFGTSAGWLPGPYVDVINDLLVATESYSEQTATLIEVALTDSLLWRVHAGWRPVAELGSYVEVHYTLMTLGGGVSDQDALVEGVELRPPSGGSSAEFQLDSVTHMVGAEAGYRWEWDSGLTLRAGVGLSITLASDFKTEATGPAPGQRAVEDGSKAYLDRIFERWVHPPYVALAVGYRFL